MTDINSANPQDNEHVQIIRNSLMNSVFGHYFQLRTMIQKLPFNPASESMQKALSYLNDGMIWAKEMLLNEPLILEQLMSQGNPETPKSSNADDVPDSPEKPSDTTSQT